MPPVQRGQVSKLPSGRWRLRYYDHTGNRHNAGSFATRSAAFTHYRHVIEPRLRGEMPDLTLSQFIDVYLTRHATGARRRTIGSLEQRLGYATQHFGDVRLREFERMVDELAGWHAHLPERSRYGILGALRQTCEAAVRWGYMGANPAKLLGPNRQPPPRTIRAYTPAELDAIAVELSVQYRPHPVFVAASGLRPEEWAPLERGDVDCRTGLLNVRRTVSDGEVVELAKTSRSRRQVPLTRRALAALDELPAQIRTPFLFPAPEGGFLRLDNFRRTRSAGSWRWPGRSWNVRLPSGRPRPQLWKRPSHG